MFCLWYLLVGLSFVEMRNLSFSMSFFSTGADLGLLLATGFLGAISLGFARIAASRLSRSSEFSFFGMAMI